MSRISGREGEGAGAGGAEHAADVNDTFKVHLLDVGEKQYGDCVLCRFGDETVLLDGSHSGDEEHIVKQLKRLLGQQTLPLRVSLIVVTHPHEDHIGCLPGLVANNQLRAEWALVADPKYRWGEADETDAFFAGRHYRARALTEALLEEDRSAWADSDLAPFIDNAGSLSSTYRTMLRQLEEGGTHVVRNGTDAPDELLQRFEGIGLKVIGPSRAHLEEAARLLLEGRDDTLDFAADAFTADETMDTVSAYRNYFVEVADASRRPNGGAINLQSIVTQFEYREEKLIFAGDMQFTDPDVESDMLRHSVRELRRQIAEEAEASPYSFVKLSHHGSHNGFDASFMEQFGASKLYGICGGHFDNKNSHPARPVLELLDEHREEIRWVRTDHNGLVTISFGVGAPKLRTTTGEINDATPNHETHHTDDAAGGVDASDAFVEEVRAGNPPAAGDGAALADAAPADALSATPPSGALAAQFNRAKANGWLPFFAEAARNFNWPVELLLAVASRETNMKNILGDGGHGHGIMQIDDRSFPEFTSSDRWKDPRQNILKGAEVLSGKRRFLSRRGVSGQALTRASVAAYNGGEGRVLRAINAGRDVDSVTTHQNYSADVLARAAVFKGLL
ncbi:MAG: MBL fold metallo-hydrolase [Acidobacteria bacterium]|nr:MBL fold metallo-hydrolase [Acidobacteriota bacterium]